MWDVIVVGLGAMGAAACWRAAKHGAKVLGLEQFDLEHDAGSSHGGSRVIRESYFEHPDYVPLLLATRPLWEELEQTTGIRCVHRVGMLFVGSQQSPVLQGSLATAQGCGIDHALLSASALAKRYPGLRPPRGAVGLFETGAGFGVPEHAIRASVQAARAFGAEIRTRCPVLGLREGSHGVEVTTEAGVEKARAVVVAAGPWAGRLTVDLGVPLRVERHLMVWLKPLQLAQCTPPHMPVWAIDEGAEGFYYGVPIAEGIPGPPGVKVGLHGPGPAVDVTAVPRHISEAEMASFGRHVNRLFPALSPEPIGAKTCLYTRSPDDHFIVDRAPGSQQIWLACGFSGHGFKFAPVMGEALAQLAMLGACSLPVQFLSLQRFSPQSRVPGD